MGRSGETPKRSRGPASDQASRILRFCTGDWRTIAEIAIALERSEETVRKHYVPALVKAGTLRRRYPEDPRHPHQAYRTAAEPDER